MWFDKEPPFRSEKVGDVLSKHCRDVHVGVQTTCENLIVIDRVI